MEGRGWLIGKWGTIQVYRIGKTLSRRFKTNDYNFSLCLMMPLYKERWERLGNCSEFPFITVSGWKTWSRIGIPTNFPRRFIHKIIESRLSNYMYIAVTCFCKCFLSSIRNIRYDIVCSARAIQQSVCNVTLLK